VGVGVLKTVRSAKPEFGAYRMLVADSVQPFRVEQARELEVFEEHLIHIAVAPIFARFKGFDDGVFCGIEMFRRVFVFGAVAATDMTAGFTKP
jgi:hypothetical protein